MKLKRTKVVMLSTNEKAGFKVGDIGLHPEQGLSLNRNAKLNEIIKALPNSANYTKQHLYFLSDEEIKEGDYFLRGSNPKFVYKCTKITNRSYWCNGNEYLKEECKKIIATTNDNISINLGYEKYIAPTNSKYDQIYTRLCPYPKPSLDFIKVYIEEYNKGSQILEVNVLYEKKVIGEKPVPFGYENIYEDNFTLKINSKDNTITIKKLKDSWNREEILNDIEQAIIQGLDIGQYRDKWIKENL